MSVSLDDADQQDRPDQRDQGEIIMQHHQAKTPDVSADGSVERMVIGWMKLS